ncbi:MAG TPA: hypothetical protein PLQ56_25125 [Aggregatilineales bacterium]|nr:hypothetical protein [Aggregatilineales bacterium]
MPIRIEWDPVVANTILYTIDSYWTWDEYLTAFMKEQTMGRSLEEAPYFTIGDMTRTRLVPRGPLFSHLTYSSHTSPPNFQHAYIVSRDNFIANMMKITIQAVPHLSKTMSLVHSMEEARIKIQSRLHPIAG